MLWHRQWLEICGKILNFVFEYRFYLDHYCDPRHMRIARETYHDISTLDEVHFGERVNDQTHRIYMPTSLPVMLMGEVMFNKKLSYLFCPGNVRNGGSTGVEEEGLETKNDLPPSWRNNCEVAKKVSGVPKVLKKFLPVINKNMSLCDPCQRKSWVLLKYHSEICGYLWEIIHFAALNKMDKAEKIIDKL